MNNRDFKKNLLNNAATSKKLLQGIPRHRTNLISKIRKILELREISKKILKVMMKKMRKKMKGKTLRAKKVDKRKRRREV
jgi:hypothetical protein